MIAVPFSIKRICASRGNGAGDQSPQPARPYSWDASTATRQPGDLARERKRFLSAGPLPDGASIYRQFEFLRKFGRWRASVAKRPPGSASVRPQGPERQRGRNYRSQLFAAASSSDHPSPVDPISPPNSPALGLGPAPRGVDRRCQPSIYNLVEAPGYCPPGPERFPVGVNSAEAWPSIPIWRRQAMAHAAAGRTAG